MRIQRATKKQATFNMTPLIDIVFMLILFFMLTLQLEKEQSGQVNLPKADQAELVEKVPPKSLSVIVLPDGRLIVNGKTMAIGDFEEQVYMGGIDPEAQDLVLRGDANVAFERIQDVMRAASLAGIVKVDLLASRETEDLSP